jgi:S-adenosylmethionine hydrolase
MTSSPPTSDPTRLARPPIIAEAEGKWYVGPGNGLFELVLRRATSTGSWDIDWKPERLSASFHGRDLFAPVAAMLARGEPPPGQPHNDGAHRRAEWRDDICEIVYIDHYGNANDRAQSDHAAGQCKARGGGSLFERAGTFSDRPLVTAFWYDNSNGLVEIKRQPGAR